MLVTCNQNDPSQRWWHDEGTDIMSLELGDGRYCLQASHGNNDPKDGNHARLYECDETNPLQQITWNKDDVMTLAAWSDLCIVFRGTHADVDVDPIIIKKCDLVEDKKRLEWEAVFVLD